MLRGARLLFCLVAAILALGIAAVPHQPAQADVTITFLPDGSDVKMVYSGTITGAPVGAPGLGSGTNYQGNRDIAADNNTSINAFYNISPTTNIFTGAIGINGNTATGPLFWLDIQQAKFYVGFNSPTQTLNGVVIFPGRQISDVGTVLTSTYTLANTTGGPGGTSDRILIQVNPGSPTVTSVTPAAGPVAGGNTVVIAGTNLLGTTAVSFGSNAASSFTIDNPSQITATVPAGTGSVDVSVTTPVATASLAGGYSYVAAPTVTNVTSSTANGTYGIGSGISIQAVFSAAVTVTGAPQLALNSGGTATYVSGSGTNTLTFSYTVGAGDSSADLDYTATSSLALNGGTITSSIGAINANLTLPAVGGANSLAGNKAIVINGLAPTVTTVDPGSGPVTGGTSITIHGTDFTGVTAVTIGGAAASNVVLVNASTITAVTPPGAVGTVDVSVTTPNGTVTATNAFSYAVSPPTISAISPDSGSALGGTKVTITGTGFSGATAVTIGGVAAASFTVVSATRITAVTPQGQVGAANVSVTTAAGTAPAGPSFTYVPPSPQELFDQSRADIHRIIQDQAVKRLSTLMSDNDRMMQDVRTRFIGFAGDGARGALTANGFDAIAFDVDGMVDVEGGLDGIVAASTGAFLGQTGMVDGANWRLSGNFDVLLDDQQTMAAFDGRVAREQFITRNVLWGAFGGGQFSRSDIADSFSGTETTWQLYGGTYAVGQVARNLFADAYASAGYGWSDLSMNNAVLALDSNYGSFTWQVGGALAGLIDMARFSLLPTLSLAYGNSNLGEIDFTARAYGVSDAVSLDADHVAMGVMRLTPELRLPLGADATVDDGLVLGLLPSFICEQVVADDGGTHCGWGIGAALVQAGDGAGQFSGKIDFQQVGGVNQVGGQISYSIQF